MPNVPASQITKKVTSSASTTNAGARFENIPRLNVHSGTGQSIESVLVINAVGFSY